MRKNASRRTSAKGPVPESYLLLAERARNHLARRRWAQTGLRLSTHKETTFLLLEQLFKAELGEQNPRGALDAANAMIGLEMLADGAFARASACHLLLGDTEAAEKALRQAVARAPGQRRAFHLWSLGAFLHMDGRLAEALQVFARAERLGSSPLTRAHAAAIRCELGEPPPHLEQFIQDLEADEGRQGYGRLILGVLLEHAGDRARAREELAGFIDRCREEPNERGAVLRRELELATQRLGALTQKSAESPAVSRSARSAPEGKSARVIPMRTARRGR